MIPGETFFGFDIQNHLWVVLTSHDGKGEVAVVNLRTHGRSPTCNLGDCVVIREGEHEFVTRDSCVYYRKATTTSGDRLNATKQRGTLQQLAPLAAEVLNRVQLGAIASDMVAREIQSAIRRTMTEAGDQPQGPG